VLTIDHSAATDGATDQSGGFPAKGCTYEKLHTGTHCQILYCIDTTVDVNPTGVAVERPGCAFEVGLFVGYIAEPSGLAV
jgi:hypothetical protein